MSISIQQETILREQGAMGPTITAGPRHAPVASTLPFAVLKLRAPLVHRRRRQSDDSYFFPNKGFLHEIEGENEAPGIESKGPPAQVRQGEAAETKVETRAQW